jgi:glycosyltransferase involved in cell wall biosynthesis
MNKDVLIEKLKEENSWYECELARLRDRINEKEYEVQNIRSSLAFRLAEKLGIMNQKLGNGIALRGLRKLKRVCCRGNMVETKAGIGVKGLYDDLLTLSEFEFYHFKESREEIYHIDLKEVMYPYVKGLVSIVLPVYNGGDLLAKSIESVLKQTYSKFEFIIVDDGSTDDTPRIIDEYALKDSRIRVIHKENEKLPKTLSRGFREARGEFFTWTSADNIMESVCIEKMVSELEDFPDTGMVFANIRLINESDDPIVTNGWYADRFHHENVMLPHCMLELNTYTNNYIGAAFMYRAVVAHAIEGYSAMKYCTEDYDYWMRINSLFLLRHTCFQEPIYNYRFHSQSLTSRDKELKISENRYRLMLLDSFRREYYMKPMVWVLEGEGTKFRNELQEVLLKAGHKVIDKQEAKLYCESMYEKAIYMQFGDLRTAVKNPEYGYRVYVGETRDEVNAIEWDCLISRNEINSEDFLEGHKGWFYFKSAQTMFRFMDAKIKNSFLYAIERIIESKPEYSKKLSVITACGSNIGDLRNILLSLEKQKAGRELCEIIVAAEADELVWVKGALDILQKKGMMLPVRVVVSPINNIVDCYNSAIWAANGEIISIFDSACYCDDDYVEKVMHCFGLYDDVSGFVMRTGKNGRIGNIVMKAEALKLAGGFTRSLKQNETATWTGWEDSVLLKLKNNGRKIIECEQISIHMADDRIMGMEDKIESFLNEYLIELNQLKPYDTWPENLRQTIIRLSGSLAVDGDHRETLKEIDGLKAVLSRVEADLSIRQNRNFIRQMYSYQFHEREDKLSVLTERGLLSKSVLLVSVIVPIYKVEDYLERCVNSILKQTITNIEVILVDDGSPDECPRLCDAYEEKDKRVKVIHKENGGLSDARNVGLDVASGKYIAFIDSDDWVEATMLEELCYAAEVFNADIAECDFCNVYKDRSINEMEGTGLYYIATNLEALRCQMDWSYFKCIACNKIYRDYLFSDGKRYPKGKYHEDEFFTHKITYEAKKLVYVDNVLYNYDHRRTDSITGSKFNVNGLDAVEAWREKANFYKSKNLSELHIQALDLYVWTALDRLELCEKEHINGERVEEVKRWLKKDYAQMVSAGINEAKLKSVEKYMDKMEK